MITLQIHPDQMEWLADELVGARDREIGGVLVGEHVATDKFRLADLSVQRSGGTERCFTCDPSHHQDFLDGFFERTKQDFSRFNYLGEWHSHPLFSVAPSKTDLTQMQELVEDKTNRLRFSMLLVVRWADPDRIEVGSLVFRPQWPAEIVSIEVVPRPTGAEPMKHRTWWRRHFSWRGPVTLTPRNIAGRLKSRRGTR